MTEASPNIPQVETLRIAARRIRMWAGPAPSGPWRLNGFSAKWGSVVMKPTATHPETEGYGGHLIGQSMSEDVRAYVKSWPPEVALAVADLLDSLADQYGSATEADSIRAALSVAELVMNRG